MTSAIFALLFNLIPALSPIKSYYQNFSIMNLGILGTLCVCLVFLNDENSTKYIGELVTSIVIYSVSYSLGFKFITADQTIWMGLHNVLIKKIFLFIAFVSCSVTCYYFTKYVSSTSTSKKTKLNLISKYYPAISTIITAFFYFYFLFINCKSGNLIFVTETFEVEELKLFGYITPFHILIAPNFLIMFAALVSAYDKMNREKFILFPCACITYSAALSDFKGDTEYMFINVLGVDLLLFYLFVNLNQNQYERAKIVNDNLVSQMKPHFMFNLLTAIISINDEGNNKKEVSAILKSFSKYLRYFVDHTNNDEIEIDFNKELEHVDYYFNLQKVRFPNIELIKEINKNDFKIPVLTLQPLIENCVNHSGITSLENKQGYIKIITYEDDKYNIIEVIDNGRGYKKDKQDEQTHKSTGVNNIRRRLEYVNLYNKLEIKSPIDSSGGTRIRILLYKKQS